jgi:VWFA-related protein
MIGNRTFVPVFCACLALVNASLVQESAAAQANVTTSSLPAATAPTLSVDARLVNLPVVVHDKKGALVQNLTKDDFTLQVDGHQQAIRYFDIDKDLPLTLGLLVDTSMSQRQVIGEERTASSAFLDQMLKPVNDQAFIVQFAHQTELLQDLTNSRPKLQAALKEIDTPSPNAPPPDDPNDPGSGGGGRGRGRGGAGTTLYDATFLASDELMGKQKGRKALVILSDGVDHGSKETLVKSIEAAQRADTIIYAIYYKGNEGQQGGRPPHGGGGGGGRFPGGGNPGGRGGGYPGGGGGGYPGGGGGGYPGGGGGQGGGGSHVDGKNILQQMADETGGRLFEVSKKQTVAQIYDQIAAELRAQYRLGYTPDQATASDGYHQIALTAHRKDLYIQTRDGYYTGK